MKKSNVKFKSKGFVRNCCDCVHIQYDSCLNGYCNNESSENYRSVVMTDKQTVPVCKYFSQLLL